MTAAPLRLGIAGLGTVGVGVLKMIQKNAALITQRTGRAVTVSAVCAQSRGKDRGVDLSGYAWEDDPVVLAKRDDVDVFVELIGGSTGPAKQATQAAIAAGKDVITANKAMLAEHGHSLALSAEAAGRVIRYEAAVAGGIPVVKALTEGLAGNEIQRVLGVMNGSCNYILTRMEDAGLTYEEVFAEADGLGYLETDPNLDVGGIDAAHKLAILASIAFGTEVDFASVVIEGIGAITIEDIHAAADMGYRVKLLGVAQQTGRGLEQRMTPCLVPANSPFGQLQGGTNMVILEGGDVGQIVLRGAGAGEGPTASAVVADLIDIARGETGPAFAMPVASLARSARAPSGERVGKSYLRFIVADRPGVLAEITAAMRDGGVSIESLSQRGVTAEGAADLIVQYLKDKGRLTK